MSNNEKPSEANIKMVCTQTNYTEAEASSKLSECNNDPVKVIRQFMGLSNKTENNKLKTTRSQERFRVIREVIYHDNFKKSLK